jgi:N-acetylmuramoyl-L-alanine amidase
MELNPGPINVPLSYWRDKKYASSRVAYLNKLNTVEDIAVISIHANASTNKGWGSRDGVVIFVPKKPSDAEINLAQHFFDRFLENKFYITLPKIKEKNVSRILSKTKCPSVLVECGFMDNERDARYLASQRGQWEIAECIFKAISDNEARLASDQ